MSPVKTREKTNTQYGLFCYDTRNIGDEIQSLAAKRFLPEVDYYINRDNIDSSIHDPSNTVKFIANGWYLEPSVVDNKKHWPPTSSNLLPLFISMHLDPTKAYKLFKKPSSIDYLKKHSPIGARDLSTQKFLESLNVPTYFSGCMTLTLLPDPKISKSNYVLAVNVNNKIIETMAQRTKRPIIKIDTLHAGILSTQERFKIAQYYLTLYQSAHCVVTTRLHTMLPCLALGTPVIAITTDDKNRFSGLIELTNSYSEQEFINNSKINLDHPPQNPRKFIPLRDNLIKKCKEFTGYDSKSSYLNDLSPDELYKNIHLQTAITKTILQGFNDRETILKSENEISGLKSVINELRSQVNNQELALQAQQQEIDTLASKLQNPGIKAASKTFARSIYKKITKQ